MKRRWKRRKREKELEFREGGGKEEGEEGFKNRGKGREDSVIEEIKGRNDKRRKKEIQRKRKKEGGLRNKKIDAAVHI